MSSDSMRVFTKDNLDTYLKELAKEYRKLGGKNMPAEVILIGGAAILANYGFRSITTDIDAIIHAMSSMKEAINHVGDRFGLPNGWLNTDFMHTKSYSRKLEQHSIYYKTFFNVLTVRTIAAEYLIAMKLRAGRRYKNDLSDVIGIMAEHEKSGEPITKERVEAAVNDLYGGMDFISDQSRTFLDDVFTNRNYEMIYSHITKEEQTAQELLLGFERVYPEITNEQNIDGILETLETKTESKELVLKELKENHQNSHGQMTRK